MARYSDTVRDQNQAPVIGALVAVTLQDGTEPAMTDDEGATLANPLTTDSYGTFYFNIVGAAYVDLKIYYGERLVTEEFGVAVGAPLPPTGAGGNSGDTQYNVGGALAGYTGPVVTAGALTQTNIAQGTIAVSTPWENLTSTWNDGLAIDVTRVQFTGIGADVAIPDPVMSVGGIGDGTANGQGHPVIGLKRNGNYFFQLTMPTYPTWGSRVSYALFYNPDDQTQYAGIGAFGSQGWLVAGTDAGTGGPSRVFTYGWDGSPGSVAVLGASASNRMMFQNQSGAIVFFAANGHYEFEGNTAEIEVVPYIGASSLGSMYTFSNNGQTGTKVTPLASRSGTASVPCFQWGSASTLNGKLMPDGSVFLGNTSAPSTPTGGGIIYVESGALKYKGSGGTVTVLGAA